MESLVNIAALETATMGCAVGLRVAGADYVTVLDHERRHTEALVTGLRALMTAHHVTASTLTRVVVDVGPGLFTGLRVGIATAQALAQGVGCELVGVTSLELLAHGAWRDGVRGELVALVDARRAELFVQGFTLGDDVAAHHHPRVLSVDALLEEWSAEGFPHTITGDGAARYATPLTAAAPSMVVHDGILPSVEAALALGATRPATAHVAPLYLREADAVANFTTRQRPT